ncbi:BnaC06g23420D [Brassica napus]|uniref:BnaC06g23420D protein n=1 Tax=Brassica napus TaxID=3708 RepID=A0A078F9F4_BRANA|nr:BnaC06g23420D [Brassica napus]
MGFLKIRPVYSFTSSPSRFSLNSRALEISDSSPLHNRSIKSCMI